MSDTNESPAVDPLAPSSAAGDPAVERLIVSAVAGASTARRELLETALLQRGAGLDPLLDALAVHAAAGEEVAVELLLEVVHRLGLARPAIAKLLPDPSAVDEQMSYRIAVHGHSISVTILDTDEGRDVAVLAARTDAPSLITSVSVVASKSA